MKKCSNCKNFLNFSEFSIRSDRKTLQYHSACRNCRSKISCEWQKENKERSIKKQRKWRKNNPEKSSKFSREWEKNNPDKVKSMQLKQHHGINLNDYNLILNSQNGICAICGKNESIVDKKTGKTRALAVDHCHKTEKIRGLLCSAHNRGLGMFHDNIIELQNAIEYLKKYV